MPNFIVIEGIDGAGSTTQANRLVEWLQKAGRKALLTCEPTRGPIGSLLRQILSGRLVGRALDGRERPVDNDVIALLFAADRIDHLSCEILPALAAGIDVVSDRYYHSSLLYQSLEGDLGWIRQLNAHARPPDITYVIDLPAAQAERRRQARATRDIYEVDDLQCKLEGMYRDLPELLPGEPVVVVDGRPAPDAVHAAIIDDLRIRLGLP